VVVQCPNCQSRFRVADGKVSERGVRVRCSACKTVFAVRKSADANTSGNEKKRAAEPTPTLSGTTKNGTAVKPVPAANPPPHESTTAAKRLAADDLFGMAELTGETAPARSQSPAHEAGESVVLGRISTPSVTGTPTSASQTALSPARLTTTAAAPVPVDAPAPQRKNDEPDPFAGLSLTATGLSADLVAATSKPAKKTAEPDPFADLSLTATGLSADAVSAAAAAKPAKKIDERDPFADLGLTAPGVSSGAAPEGAAAEKPRRVERVPPTTVPIRKPAEEGSGSTRRELVASALTGIVVAALVLAGLRVASLSEGLVPSWLAPAVTSEIVATRIRSGLYDTSTGKPVYFVRGKIENRGKSVRGPVRVVAELVGRSGVDARAEAVAGIEPSAEDVYALRSPADADKLVRTLAGSEGDRRIQPGSSVPFFALIADPPADLARHKLTVRIEPLEPPGAPRSAEGPR
jgi:predicted Zn finger-like uncharacterized protein